MRLFLVKEQGEPRWVAALANENMYGYVANTGKFHDNYALRNDYYMERDFTYEEIGPAEARRLIDGGLGRFDESEDDDVLALWRDDPRPLDPADVLSIVAGFDR
ncbi:hypothetical protein [Kribbella sindirgiensis]|uniref:Uncharacterized protein n=1 Tax=Kribbella sindirgiensis TaxID=1124744 RepID=A0A4R0IQI7_9ACTN|nr:hypothetical protein [Kribbella sindirgiensis]TCC33706.1 hypothetical protein E0H50_17340 [Kribbella sindirgiensis]